MPIGTGLNIKAGELISLLNYESGEAAPSTTISPRAFSGSYGQPPAAGVQLTYNVTDWLDVKARKQNGMYAGPVDNNQSKTTMIAVDIKPTKKLWFSLVWVRRPGRRLRAVPVGRLGAGRISGDQQAELRNGAGLFLVPQFPGSDTGGRFPRLVHWPVDSLRFHQEFRRAAR